MQQHADESLRSMRALRGSHSACVARPELSILLCAINEGGSIGCVLDAFSRVFHPLVTSMEVIVVDGGSTDDTANVAASRGARVIVQEESGYGSAVQCGLKDCRGDWILVADCDGSHPAEIAAEMWGARHGKGLVAASRFSKGGRDLRNDHRLVFSRLVNGFYRCLFRHPQFDYTGAFRLYRNEFISGRRFSAKHFDIQPEIAVMLLGDGVEYELVPYAFQKRIDGASKARVAKYGSAYLMRAFILKYSLIRRLWATKLRTIE